MRVIERVGSLRGVPVAALLVTLTTCGDVEPPRGAVAPRDEAVETRVPAPLPGAYCDIVVDGVGTLAMEEDYLPRVVTCENGGANLEALKAQAIAARSVAYYAMATSGSICDSQGCQVYGCGASPSADAIAAVEATRGLYLSYSDVLTYGFYVAGDPGVSGPTCIGDLAGGATEQWVTYNAGQTGTNVEQTNLGWVHDPADPGYGQNRGCMSQWGARCLENDNGADFTSILRFFYGEDIEVLFAAGACTGTGDGDGDSGTSTTSTSGTAEDGSTGDESVGDGDGDGSATGTGTTGASSTSGDGDGDSAGTGTSSGDGDGDGSGTGTGTEGGLLDSGTSGTDDGTQTPPSGGCSTAVDPGPIGALWWVPLVALRRRRVR